MDRNTDAIALLGKQRAVRLAVELERQLANKEGLSLIQAILFKAQYEAGEAMCLLAFHDCDDQPKTVAERTKLQNDVRLYDYLVRWLREIAAEGYSADQEITAEEREELADLLCQTPEGQREAAELGLVETEGLPDGA